MKSKTSTLVIGLLLLLLSHQSSAQSKDEMLIRSAMQEQLAAWNSGDIERYMETYWKSDSLMFVGKAG